MPNSTSVIMAATIPTQATFDGVMSEIEQHGTWHGPDPSLFVWTLLAHVELRDGKLGIAWDAFTQGLHDLTDSIKDIQEHYHAFLSESFSPIRTEIIGRCSPIAATC
jgi:hypothetical protein